MSGLRKRSGCRKTRGGGEEVFMCHHKRARYEDAKTRVDEGGVPTITAYSKKRNTEEKV